MWPQVAGWIVVDEVFARSVFSLSLSPESLGAMDEARMYCMPDERMKHASLLPVNLLSPLSTSANCPTMKFLTSDLIQPPERDSPIMTQSPRFSSTIVIIIVIKDSFFSPTATRLRILHTLPGPCQNLVSDSQSRSLCNVMLTESTIPNALRLIKSECIVGSRQKKHSHHWHSGAAVESARFIG